jgi:hypothetical protein
MGLVISERDQKDGELNPARRFHIDARIFPAGSWPRADKQKQQCDNPDNGRFHFVLLQLLAKTDVESARDKKGDDDPNENEVAHKVRLIVSEILPAR